MKTKTMVDMPRRYIMKTLAGLTVFTLYLVSIMLSGYSQQPVLGSPVEAVSQPDVTGITARDEATRRRNAENLMEQRSAIVKALIQIAATPQEDDKTIGGRREIAIGLLGDYRAAEACVTLVVPRPRVGLDTRLYPIR